MTSKIHVFCLDFASAMLANITHTPYTLNYFEQNPIITAQVTNCASTMRLTDWLIGLTKYMENLLKFIRENIPVSVLMHILICLSYLSKDVFQQ